MKVSFWEQIFPRLIAVGVYAYLFVDLLLRSAPLGWLHIIFALIGLALIFIPIAGSFKLLDLVKFEKKVTQSTKKLESVIEKYNTVIESKQQSEQKQYTIINLGDSLEKYLGRPVGQKEAVSQKDLADGTESKIERRARLLERINACINRTFDILFVARGFQILAVQGNDAFQAAQFGTGDRVERIRVLIKKITENNVGVLVPEKLINETNKVLGSFDRLIEIKDELKADKIELSAYNDVSKVVNDMNETCTDILLGTVVTYQVAVAFRESLMNKLEEMKKRYLPKKTSGN